LYDLKALKAISNANMIMKVLFFYFRLYINFGFFKTSILWPLPLHWLDYMGINIESAGLKRQFENKSPLAMPDGV